MDPRSQILDHVAGVQYFDIPSEVKDAARVFLTDTVGVGLAGSTANGADELVAASQQWGRGDIPVIGRKLTAPREVAALLNGFFIHNLEWDCVHEPAVVHALSVITAVCLAEAASNPAITGEEFVTAVTLGVDIAAGLGVATDAPLRFFRPATNGCIGAALAAARLRGLPRDRFDDVLGLAYSQVSGTMQAHVEGSVTLPLQVAIAARAAVTAVDMAQMGLTAPHDVLDGPFGYFKLIEDGGAAARVAARLGNVWAIAELSHKPYPSGRASHAVLEFVLRSRAPHGFSLKDVTAIKAQVTPLIHRLIARPYKADMSAAYARLCLPYLCGLAVRDGVISPNAGDEINLRDPELAQFALKVEITRNEIEDPNAMSPQAAQIHLADGTILDEPIPSIYGSPAFPMMREDYLEKFERAATFAYDVPPETAVAQARDFLMNIDKQQSVAALFTILN